jgi:Rrf2 family nitric oxide-sensitive transcriptional repressor
MRLLASTDIALRVLMMLGQAKSRQPMNVGTLAERLGGLSRNHLHKIVQDLAGLGLVRTVRGAGGGVTLAASVRDIRIGPLIRTLEQDHALVECFRADGGCCVLTPGCRLRGMLAEAKENFYASLDRRTLADCLRVRPPAGVAARKRARLLQRRSQAEDGG